MCQQGCYAPLLETQRRGDAPSAPHFASPGSCQTMKIQFATGVKKNKRKHLRQDREGANLPFYAGAQYNRLYLQPLQSVVTG